MKKFTLIFAVLCLIGMTAMAQDNQRGGRMDPTKMVTRMDEGMAKNITGLTDAQKEKIHSLNTDYVTNLLKNLPQMQGQRPSDEEMQQMRTKMEENRKAYNTSLKSILSDSQYAEYEKYEKSQHQRGGQFGGAPQGAPQGEPQGEPNN